jgi:transcriptional regulator with XRE-family HTH domain
MRKSMSSLSKFLKEKRQALGMSQLDVARKLGYSSAQFVSNWERNLVAPPIDTLAVLIDLYKIPPAIVIQKIVEDTKGYLDEQLGTQKKRKATLRKQMH